MRISKVKVIGNSYFFHIRPADVKDFNIIEGDEYDIETTLLTGKIKRKEVKKDGNTKREFKQR